MRGIQNAGDFAQGLVTVYDAAVIPDGASPDMENWDISKNVGSLTKRDGQAVLYTEKTVAAFPKVCGMHQFITSGGTKYFLVAANDDVYNVTGGGTYTSIFTDGGNDGTDINFATFKDLAVWVGASITTQSWNGAGSSSSLLGSPPSNAKYITAHKNRLWIGNTSAGHSRLHYCADGDGEDWTSTGVAGAGFIDINKNDGDVITGLASVGNVLIVFKNRSIWRVLGSSPPFTVAPVSSINGCVAPKSIVPIDNFCLFLSNNGLYYISEDRFALMSYNIKNTIESLSSTVKQGAVAGRCRTNYWLAYDSDADSKNDKCFLLDYVSGSWFKYSNIKANRFLTIDDGTLLSGGSDKVIVRQHETTQDDEGSAITAYWKSKEFAWGGFYLDKQLEDFFLTTDVLSSGTITLTHAVEGKVQSDSVSFALDAIAASDTIVTNSTRMPDTSNGKKFQFIFTNAQTGKQPRILDFSSEAEIRPRVN